MTSKPDQKSISLCHECGAPTQSGDVFCRKCGKALSSSSTVMEVSPTTRLLFDCSIFNPGRITLLEKIGRGGMKDPLIRPATFILERQRFSLTCMDMFGQHVRLVDIPTDKVDRVVYGTVGKRKWAQVEVLSFIAYGALLGVVVSAMLLWHILRDQDMTSFDHMTRFLAISLGTILVLAGGGLLVGLGKIAFWPGHHTKEIEFTLLHGNDPILTLFIPPTKRESVQQIFSQAGWLLSPFAAEARTKPTTGTEP